MNRQRILLSVLILLGLATMAAQSPQSGFSEESRPRDGTFQSVKAPEIWSTQSKQTRSVQRQRNVISLDATALDSPHWLTIRSESSLTGSVRINGETVQNLEGTEIEIDVAPYLTNETTVIDISGSYAPETATVSLSFKGPGTTVSQQMSGSGRLDYELVLEAY